MSRFFTLLLAAFCLTAVGQVPDYVPTDGMVAWLQFNGNAIDESLNGHDGEVDGAILTADRFGNASSAYQSAFNGLRKKGVLCMNNELVWVSTDVGKC